MSEEIIIDLVELEAPVTDEDHRIGPDDAPLTLVDYSDYQCESCIYAFHAVEKLIETHGDRLLVVYRHFPLVTYHPMAMPGALAADAAGLQGKFWEMHRLIFGAAGQFEEADLVRWAQHLGLDMDRFEDDRHQPALEEHIRQVRLEGARTGVNGTPTFFLGGVRIDPDPTWESLSAYVDHFMTHLHDHG